MDFNLGLHPVILENDSVLIRAISNHREAKLLYPILLNESLLEFSSTKVSTEKEADGYFKEAFEGHKSLMRYPFMILDKKNKKWVGSTSYGNISNRHKRIEIGWTWISKTAQRTGINRNCKFLLLQYAFESLNFNRVELKADSRNKQSIKAIESIGAKYEGSFRHHVVMPDGFVRDTVYYSILKEEWPKLKSGIFNQMST